jgi:pyruvate/2-oxoglutarate dehydrogenase complex dihydrolipoamide dehydrogenase (E3) component
MIALAVTAHLKVVDILDTLLVHPSLAEAVTESAE